jgi:hypothetical protein
VQNNYKKDIQTLEEYSIMLCNDELINHLGCISTPTKNALFPIKVSDKKILLLPAPEFSSLLYRGENNSERKTCKPSLMRVMSNDERLICILKKQEFLSAIETHTLIKIFRNKYFLENYPQLPNYKLKIDYEAIAQHYEFKTDHLDLTREKSIAMFFMTSKYDNKLKRYFPISDKSKKGVLYTYDFKLGIIKGEHSINPIGFQPFSRPDKQKAFSIIFNKDVDFNDFNFVKRDEFKLRKEFCEYYYDMFEGGDELFPKDEISELAYEIQNSNYISKDAVEYYSQSSQIPKELIVKTLMNNNIKLTDNKYSFNIHNMELFNKNLQNIINDLDNRISPRGIAKTKSQFLS